MREEAGDVDSSAVPVGAPRAGVARNPTAHDAVVRLAAFSTGENGGNPAGVVLDLPVPELTDERMHQIAGDVGFSETVFVVDGPVTAGRRTYEVRYFSPDAEVPFCGHATIALGAAIAERVGDGELVLTTLSGAIRVATSTDEAGQRTAQLVSAPPVQRPVDQGALAAALRALHWDATALDQRIPPIEAYAGAWHLVLAVHERRLLTDLSYEYSELRALCLRHGWVPVHIAYMERPDLHHVRAPFPFGGVIEDPATGAGAAAYGAYLRELDVLDAPCRIEIRQGYDMGSPCDLAVTIPAAGPVQVGGRVRTM